MSGTTINNKDIVDLYKGLFSNIYTGDLYYVPDKLPLFRVRFPRKLKKKLKKRKI